ncbi:response regulator [bacterium]|nr:response regulator [bacterium]
MEKLLTIAEVAARLSLTPQTIYKKIKEGTLPAVRVGSQWRVPEDKITSWLDSQKNLLTNEDSYQSHKITTVLAVDDDPIMHSLVTDLLQPLGINVLSANNVTSAVEIAKKHGKEIDVVILDVIMPDENGFTAFYEMRKNGLKAPVIFSTAFADSDEFKKIRETEEVSVVHKPFKKGELLEALAETISPDR